MIDFAYEMLGIALRAVGVFAFWGGLICLLWGGGHAVSCGRAVG